MHSIYVLDDNLVTDKNWYPNLAVNLDGQVQIGDTQFTPGAWNKFVQKVNVIRIRRQSNDFIPVKTPAELKPKIDLEELFRLVKQIPGFTDFYEIKNESSS